jgi:histidinol-phosphate phosphatase family protein
MKKCIFLDRDGVINNNSKEYVKHPDEFILYPGAIKALKRLSMLGYELIVVTNQSGIARGYYTEEDLQNIHKKMIDLTVKEGVYFAGIYYCPHLPEKKCSCRKPGHGMLLAAIGKHKISPEHSFMVGDKTSDIMAGKSAGCRTILVRTGYGGSDNRVDIQPDYTVDDLFSAALLIEKLNKKN